jgi:adenine-specific DNA methylase
MHIQKKTTPSLSYYSALPPYFGGKRKLNLWIFKTLAQALPASEWHQARFLDAFAGGCSVSLFAKTQGFQAVYANDWSDRTQIILQAVLVNQGMKLTRDDLLFLTQPLEAQGFITERFVPSVFSTRHAEALDRLSFWATQFQHPTRQALGKLLLWHLIPEFVCMATSIGTSNRPYAEVLDQLRDWQSLNLKRFLDDSFPKLLKPTWSTLEKHQLAINRGIFTGSPVYPSQLDAQEFIQQTQGEILYLDPPYPGTLSYEATHRVLDQILTGQHADRHSSPFSQGTQALDTLLESARHIQIWLLSYGSKQLSLEELVSLVKRHAGSRQVHGFTRTYAHLAHVSRQQANQEYLILAH